MKPSKMEVVRTGLARALFGLWTLTALVTGLSIALVAQSWLAAVLGLAACVTMAALQMRQVAFWRNVISELRRRQPPLPSEFEISDETARIFLIRLERARRERERALACSPATLSPSIVTLMEISTEAEERALALIQSRDRLGRYLIRRQEPRPIPILDEPADADEAWSARMLEEHAAAGLELAVLRDRLDARLVAIIDTLAVIPCRIVAVRMADHSELSDTSDREVRERLGSEMSALRDLTPAL